MSDRAARRRRRDVTVTLTCFGLLADIAFFQQTIGVLLIGDDQPLVGWVYILAGAAVFLYLATFGWANVQRVMRRTETPTPASFETSFGRSDTRG